MKKPVFAAMALALGLLAPGLSGADGISSAVPRMTVTGQGQIASVPDMASIRIGVQTEARTAKAALAQNAEASSAVFRQLSDAGIAPRDMQTSGLSLSPLWSNRESGRPRITGFGASNQLSVRVRDLDRLGALLDLLVGNGANQLNGISFGLQDPVPAADKAREAAVKDALRKARLYAGAAGISLGPILELRDTDAPAGPRFEGREMAMSREMPIAQGEVLTRSSVTITFEISH